MKADWAIALLILTPLVMAALSFACPRQGHRLAWAAVVVTGFALYELIHQILMDGARAHQLGGWPPPLGISLRADGLAVLMLLVSTLIGASVALYAKRYFAPDPGREEPSRQRHFWPLFLFLWSALNALFLSADIFNLYITLELLGFAAVTLVALAGSQAALAAALRYLFLSLTASLFYLAGVGLVYGQWATVDLAILASRSQSGPALGVALALMTGGLVAKAALFPLHFWLPPAHANAPAPVSALLSALVVKGAFYILLRLWFEAFPGLLTPLIAQGFGLLGAAAIFWGSIHALFQPRLKLLVAYSTVAQLGYLFLLFPLATGRESGFMAWSGGLIFLGAHACAKTAMFLAAGNIHHAAGHDRIQEIDGITHLRPISVFAFALSGMSLIGLPPSGGFAGKWLLLHASLAQGQWGWAVVMLLGSLLAAAYVMRVLTHAFTRAEKTATSHPIPALLEWTAFGLALLAVVLGFASEELSEWLSIGAPIRSGEAGGGVAP